MYVYVQVSVVADGPTDRRPIYNTVGERSQCAQPPRCYFPGDLYRRAASINNIAMSIEDVDSAIAQLLSVQTSAPGIEVNLPEDLIIKIVRKGRDVFMQQPILLELNAPINIWYDS